jgi:RNA polymerase sigma factor (sigma-70 family)
VARARRGDDVAFEVLYERHVPGVLSFCRHLLGSREEGEDAVQQAFTSAHRELTDGGERELRFKPWIYAVARNRCVSILRARRPETVELRNVPATAGLAEEVAARADLRELLSDLAELDDEQRAALVLTELGDLSHAEVAQVLDREESSVKGLVFRARAALGERRVARGADCDEIRAQLAIARGGAFRRGVLTYHLRDCAECREYLEELRRQRRMMAAILPVVPTLALKESVMAATGVGATAGGGALVATGLSATAAKVAAVAVLAGGAGIAGEKVVSDSTRDAESAPAVAAPARPAGTFGLPAPANGTRAPAPVAKSAPAHRGRNGSGPAGQAPNRPQTANPGSASTPPGRAAPKNGARGKPALPGGRSGAAPGQAKAPRSGHPAAPGANGVRAHGVPAKPPVAKPDKVAKPE